MVRVKFLLLQWAISVFLMHIVELETKKWPKEEKPSEKSASVYFAAFAWEINYYVPFERLRTCSFVDRVWKQLMD